MKYTVDEDNKRIDVYDDPSLLAFSEMVNKRFPNGEWKNYTVFCTPKPAVKSWKQWCDEIRYNGIISPISHFSITH